MVKTTTTLMAALFALSMVGCDDGPVGKRLNCRQICDKAEDCLGNDNFDAAECREECREDVDADDVAACEECLDDENSCLEASTCAAKCSSVIAGITLN